MFLLCAGVSESWCPGVITHTDGIGCLWSVDTEILSQVSGGLNGSTSEATVDEC